MNLKLILFAISIIQFSACHPISNESLHCSYKNNENLDPFIAVNCEGAAFHPSICDNLEDDVNVSSVSTVLFQNCKIAEYSDILNQFPNISKLSFSINNILPSANFSSFEHLSLFKSVFSKINTTTTSAIPLSMNAADLKSFYFNGDQISNEVSSILLQNATQLEYFYLESTMVSSLPADLFKNSNNLTVVYAPRNKIENIDSMNWPHSVHFMVFSSNKISQLTRNLFKNLTNLRILDMGANEINKIEAATFSQLNKIFALDLHSNRIKEISKTTLEGLNNLIYADFRSNEIIHIESGAFESTSKLVALRLSNNNISSINSETFTGLNSSLVFLELDGASIRELTAESFGNLSQLRYLKIRDANLETIDFNAFASLPKLGHINLAGNKISRLVKMAPTSWNNNNQTTNNTFINDMAEIVNGLDLKWVKPNFTKARPLENEAIKNHFGLLPDESVLRKLMVDQIMKVFPELGKGSNYGLKNLVLSINQLTEIDKNIFDEFKGLTELALDGNPITTLYPESFGGLNELESLNLDYCKLTSVDLSMFTHLTKLQKLHLSNNRLTTITAAPLPSIVRLGLNDNQLTDFPMKKNDFPNLKTFMIYNNRLNCSNMDDSFANVEFICHSQNLNNEIY